MAALLCTVMRPSLLIVTSIIYRSPNLLQIKTVTSNDTDIVMIGSRTQVLGCPRTGIHVIIRSKKSNKKTSLAFGISRGN